MYLAGGSVESIKSYVPIQPCVGTFWLWLWLVHRHCFSASLKWQQNHQTKFCFRVKPSKRNDLSRELCKLVSHLPMPVQMSWECQFGTKTFLYKRIYRRCVFVSKWHPVVLRIGSFFNNSLVPYHPKQLNHIIQIPKLGSFVLVAGHFSLYYSKGWCRVLTHKRG